MTEFQSLVVDEGLRPTLPPSLKLLLSIYYGAMQTAGVQFPQLADSLYSSNKKLLLKAAINSSNKVTIKFQLYISYHINHHHGQQRTGSEAAKE